MFCIFQTTTAGAAGLLAIIDSRFASNFYAAQRVLRDKPLLEQLFTSAALADWLAKYRPKAGELNLRAEFTYLKDEMIFFPRFWKKLFTYVNFTEFMVKGLRKADTDSPNLHLMLPAFELARIQCYKIAREAVAADPDLYVPDLASKVDAAFAKREADIVTPLARAAAFVDPLTAYTTPQPTIAGGFMALAEVMKKYYQEHADPAATSTAAMAQMVAFREGTGEFFSNGNG